MKSIIQNELHISPLGAQALALRILQCQQEKNEQPIARRPETDGWGDPIPKMRMADDVAVIPISGPLVQGATGSEKKHYGLSDYDDIKEDASEALNKGAKIIVFDMSSPGGSVVGCPECADYIAGLGDSVMTASFNGNHSCSAAEYLTAGCNVRISTPSAINGSIGTVMTIWSFEKLLENFGVKAQIIASGKYKAAGHPAMSLTEEQREHFKGFVMESADKFKGWMTKHRKAIKDDSMQGQWFDGEKALALGFVDYIAPNLASAIALLRGQS